MIARLHYLDELKPYINKPLIKVLTGIRRCGKSCLLKLLQAKLVKMKIPAAQILYYSFESMHTSELSDYKKLYQEISQKITKKKRYYILLDEIQEVLGWEKAINSFLVDFDVDIYLTGSNSKLLSSELSTYLSGRYIEFQIATLSFREYLSFKEIRTQQKTADVKREFKNYVRLGGFPVLHLADYEHETAYKIVNDIYTSIILRDTIQRNNIRNIELLERVVKYVFDNIGNTFSAKNVADYFKSQQRKIDTNTVYNYLAALEAAYIIQKAPRYDIKGKEILKTFEKYFVSDISLVYALLGYRDRFIAGILENIVFLELRRRGYKVYVGKLYDQEIDFIAEKKAEKLYLQVAYLLPNAKTVKREFAPLLAIKDHYPKFVLSMDDFFQDNIDGVQHRHLAEFLAG